MVTLTSSTLYGNSAYGNGGAIGTNADSGNITIQYRNTLFAYYVGVANFGVSDSPTVQLVLAAIAILASRPVPSRQRTRTGSMAV